MRAKLVCSIVLLAAATAPCIASHAQDAVSAKSFLTSIYRHYQNGGKGIDFGGPHSSLYFTSSLLALEKADVKANKGEIPAIDYDPLCGCQDWDGIWDLKVDVEVYPSRKALANISFSLRDPKYKVRDEMRKLVVTLVVDRGAWRIDDILDGSDPKMTFSVRNQLQYDLAMIRKNPAPPSH